MNGASMKVKGDKEEKESSKEKLRTFQVGDLAVYPAHGVGKIEAIEGKVISGEKQDFYIMKILENDMVIMIPVSNANSVGLRDVIDKEEVPGVYAVMQSEITANNEMQTWNRRYREYMDKIKTGSIHDIAEVFRDLSIIKFTKELSFGERKLYETSQTLLVKEISIAKEESEETVTSEIDSFFTPPEPEEENPESAK